MQQRVTEQERTRKGTREREREREVGKKNREKREREKERDKERKEWGLCEETAYGGRSRGGQTNPLIEEDGERQMRRNILGLRGSGP